MIAEISFSGAKIVKYLIMRINLIYLAHLFVKIMLQPLLYSFGIPEQW